MYVLKRLALVSAVVLVAVLVMLFVLENRQPVSLVVFGLPAPAMPVAVLVLTAFVIGLSVGPLLGVGMLVRYRLRAQGSAGKSRN